MANPLQDRIATTAFAFRGYNVTNLGRSGELLQHPRYGAVVEDYLRRASKICTEVTGKKTDLQTRIRSGKETSLSTYHEAVALIVAVEIAQMRLLEIFFDVDFRHSPLIYGYSLGEISALVAAGVFDMEEALLIPLTLAGDCVALARDVRLGVAFSRGVVLPMNEVERLCLRINQEGRGVMGISTFLSPNSVLVMGQADTLDRFAERVSSDVHPTAQFRKNTNRFPPLHTPILWQHNVPNRAARMMHTLAGGFTAPSPPVFSLVTGNTSYNDHNTREIIHRWIDHPQRLWDAIYQTLDRGIERVIHVGPEPNILPATFRRLSNNVEVQTRGQIGLRTLKAIVPHPWLKRLLPTRAALLRAPLVEQVMLEDWLLENEPQE